jgi:hypothetical protein
MMQQFTFVLIPGAGGSAWYWHLVAPLLKQRGHGVVPVGLPAADDQAGLPQYAATVIRAIGDRGPGGVVLVAQSLAGFTVPLVCQEVAVALIALVNAMVPKPGETPGGGGRIPTTPSARRTCATPDKQPLGLIGS